MKIYLLKSLALIFALSLISCSDDEVMTQVMECPDNALHTIDDATGTMVYLSCYNAWGVQLDEALPDEETTIGASLDVNESFQVEGLAVQIDACFYEFDLPLLFPDPVPWGMLYNMENIKMVGE